MTRAASLRVLLAGTPNCGKSSIFNALTGSVQRVGNYPGVTVERREGHFVAGGRRVEVLDLPGTYSLASYSPEERIAQAELLSGRVDIVVVVVDSTALPRSLGLLAQLALLPIDLVLCLNMADEATRAGQRIDLQRLEQRLGIPVVETVGHKRLGQEALKRALGRASRLQSLHPFDLGDDITGAIAEISAALRATHDSPPFAWVAYNLLMGRRPNPDVRDEAQLGYSHAARRADALRQAVEARAGLDISALWAVRVQAAVASLLDEVLEARARPDATALSERIDRVVAHRVLGIPLFLAVMYGVFWITFRVGEIPMAWIEGGFERLAVGVSALWPQGVTSPLRSLLVDGVIGGVGGVLVFLPNIILLFLCLCVLEDTGYMARAAFLVDRAMRRFGLHGQSFVPMVTGFGCSVPGIMATRTLASDRDRLTTILVLPLMSCGARLPIWMLLIPAFFAPSWRAPMLWGIYMVGILLAIVLALTLRRSLLRGENAPFVMHLPPYRLPTVRSTAIKLTNRSWLYLRKAGTLILAASVVMWFITAHPKPAAYSVDAQLAPPAGGPANAEAAKRRAAEDLRASLAGQIGTALEPIFAPIGFDWRITTATLSAFAAKEVFVAQMGIVSALGETDETSNSLSEHLRARYSPLVGLSLMLFLLVAAPCMATVAITRRESGSWRWALFQFVGLTLVAYLLSLVVYQVGSLFT